MTAGPPPPPARDHVAAVLLALAVGVAFADSSVVVLALPELYGEFDTSIVAVSWVITAYNVVVAAVGLGLAPLARRLPARPLAALGLALFAVASLACGLASSFEVLVAARCAQGLGGALLLAAALPVLSALTGGHERGAELWGLAATVGAAVGPALGGALTQLLTWRSIFLFQAPVAAAAMLAAGRRPAGGALVTPVAPPEAGRRSPRAVADAGFVLVFAALVGALFLAVLLVVVAWRYSPVAGAALVSALPVGALAARGLAGRAGVVVAGVGGAALLAGGLVALALVPGESPGFAVAGLAACGLGLGMVSRLLGPASLGSPPSLSAASATIGARHLGFVLGLVVIAPVLAGDLESATREAARAGTATVLDARIPLDDKVPLILDLRQVIEDTPRGQVPDLGAAFAGVGPSEAMATVRADLEAAIGDAITRAFRTAFLVAALFALAAAVPCLVIAQLVAGPRTRAPAGAVLAVGLVAVVALVGGELGAGAARLGDRDYVEPCAAPDDPFPEGEGLDGILQRITLSGLNGAACELGTGREELVLSLSPTSGFGDEVTWDEDTLEQALRAGFRRAVDDAEARGDLPGWAAAVLGPVLERVPVDWLLGRVDLGGLER